MKRVLTVLCLVCFSTVMHAQWSGYPGTGGSELDGGVGMTWIDDQTYFSITFQPDIGIGKLGIGLNLDLLINTATGKIRTGDWDDSYDYARIIRYLRWGFKGDNVYARLGALDAERLGHGFIINYYNNQINYDERKIGLSFDLDLGIAGFETMTNNLGRLEVIGGRAYIRPMNRKPIPVLKNLGFGASYVTDTRLKDPEGADDSVEIMGLDVDLPIIKGSFLSWKLYADFAKIVDYGSGQAYGTMVDLNALWNFLNVSVNFERRYQGKEFIANYFGPMYEVLRHTSYAQLKSFYTALGGQEVDAVLNYSALDTPISKKALLPMMNTQRNGWYGAMYLNFLRLITVMGSYQFIDDQDASGSLHCGALLSENIPLITAEASYDKIGIENFDDVRTLDNRSLARVGVGYKLKPYLLIYMDYIWSFVWSAEHEQFVSQERIQPRIAFRYPFKF